MSRSADIGTVGWCMFGEDWGAEDVIFATLRSHFSDSRDAFFRLTQEDIEELQIRGRL